MAALRRAAVPSRNLSFQTARIGGRELFDWLDVKFQEILITVGTGAALGTLWRMVMRPETDFQRFIVRFLVCLSVGSVVGGAFSQYMGLDGFLSVGAGSVAGLLGEEVLLFIRARGRQLEKGKIDISLGGGDDD